MNILYRFIRFILHRFHPEEAQLLDAAVQAYKYGDINDKLEETPVSLCSMTRIYLPQIQADFPEFSWPEAKNRIQDAVLQLIQAIDAGDASRAGQISMEAGNYAHEILSDSYQHNLKNVQIHDTVITHYDKKDGTCMISTETSVGYKESVTDSAGTLVRGNADRTHQVVYQSQLLYVQDVKKSTSTTTALSAHCPNCGAPITNLGAKFCEYCKSAIEPVNVRVWRIGGIGLK